MAEDPIVYRYKPVVEGDGYPGVPARDLRQSDVDELIGEALRHVTQPAGEGIYRLVKHENAPPEKPSGPKAAADDKKGGE